MRMNINHATKAGVTVHEYKVLEKRDLALEAEFDRIPDNRCFMQVHHFRQFHL